jgi:hypothetical protein
MFYGESIKEPKVIHHIEFSLYEGVHYNVSLLHIESVVIPVNVLERTVSDSRLTQTFEYFIKVKD